MARFDFQAFVDEAVLYEAQRLAQENKRLRNIAENLADQCRTIIDNWPEFQLDMQTAKPLWRKATEKYLKALEAGTDPTRDGEN